MSPLILFNFFNAQPFFQNHLCVVIIAIQSIGKVFISCFPLFSDLVEIVCKLEKLPVSEVTLQNNLPSMANYPYA